MRIIWKIDTAIHRMRENRMVAIPSIRLAKQTEHLFRKIDRYHMT